MSSRKLLPEPIATSAWGYWCPCRRTPTGSSAGSGSRSRPARSAGENVGGFEAVRAQYWATYRSAVELRSATMEKESSSSSGAGGSRQVSVLYAVFAIFTLSLAVVAVVAMVLRFGQ